MADFTTFTMSGNTGSNAVPTWTVVSGANHEVRWYEQNNQDNKASASWLAMVRPIAPAIVNYTYCFTADATGTGFIGSAGAPPAFSKDNFNWARWNWDALGTFGDPPITTAYPTIGHGAIVRGDGSLLGGSSDTTPVATAFSYLKGNAWGRVDSAGAPAAGPGAAPAVTDGTAGSVSPAAGANWLANFQSLQGDNDFITAPFTPAATTADTWHIEFALFTGPNETLALYQVQITIKYTFV